MVGPFAFWGKKRHSPSITTFEGGHKFIAGSWWKKKIGGETCRGKREGDTVYLTREGVIRIWFGLVSEKRVGLEKLCGEGHA